MPGSETNGQAFRQHNWLSEDGFRFVRYQLSVRVQSFHQKVDGCQPRFDSLRRVALWANSRFVILATICAISCFRQGRMAMRGIERQDDIETNIRVDPVGEQVTGNPGQGIVPLSFWNCRADTTCAIPSPMLQPQRQLSLIQLANRRVGERNTSG